MVSPRKLPAHRKAAKWRRDYLEQNSGCWIGTVLHTVREPQAVFCTRVATELHERVKRSRGGSTTDPGNVIPTCRNCHEWTEREPQRATELGLLAPNRRVHTDD